MKNFSLATTTYAIGYIIVTIVGFTLYIGVSPFMMWVGHFTFMPLVFVYLAYRYFKGSALNSNRDAVKLGLYWIVLSTLLDAAIYILILPLTLGAKPNWTFFIDQSPWLWLSYLTIFIISFAGLHAYRRKLSKISGFESEQNTRCVSR